jgi:hypothetical protein
VLDRSDVKVDGLDAGVRVGLPLAGLELRLGRVVCGGGESADADDGATDGTAETVGCVLEGLLLGDGRLDLRAPAAQGDPESVGGEDGKAECLAQAEDRQREE